MNVRRLAPYLLLALICTLLFFWQLGSSALIGLDEGLYAECSREMLAGGDYIVPTCNGLLFLDKPPLVYWLQAASMSAFGVTSLGARLPSAFAAFALVGFIVFLGTKLKGHRSGLMAGFILATAVLTTGLARLAIMDQIFTLAIAVSLGSFILTYLGRFKNQGYLLFWAAMSISVLIKGPAGMVVICSVVGAFLLLKRDLRFIRQMSPIFGIMIFLALALPWYIAVQVKTDGFFAREFFVHQNLQRAMGEDFQHNQPFWFYLPIFLVGFFPWSVFVPLACRTEITSKAEEPSTSASLFAAVWMVVVVALFSLSRSKLPSYIFPMYPPAALLVGAMWSRAMRSGKTDSLRRYSWLLLAIALIMAVAFRIGPRFLREPIPGLDGVLTAMGILLVVGSALAVAFLSMRRIKCAFGALCVGMAAFMTVAILGGLPLAIRSLSEPMVEMAEIIKTEASPDDSVVAYRLLPPQPGMAFYAQRPIPSLSKPEELIETISKSRAELVVLQDKDIQDLPEGGTVLHTSGKYLLYRFNAATVKD